MEVLDISSNNIGVQDRNSSVLIASAFKYLVNLKKLVIAKNGNFAGNDQSGSLVEALQFPLSLQYLDLSYCFLGFRGDNLDPLWANLENLSQLAHLDLSGSYFSGSNSSALLVKALDELPNLEFLFLDSCLSCDTNSAFISPVVASLGGLGKLRYLSLFDSCFGVDSLLLQLAESIKKLTRLEMLRVSNSGLGTNGSVSVVGFAEALGSLQNLVNFDVSENFLGELDTDGINAIINSFYKLPHLRQVNLDGNNFSFNETKTVNLALQSLGAVSRVGITIVSGQDVDDFFANFPPNASRLDLSSVLSGASPEAMSKFVMQLRLQTQLVFLDLSANDWLGIDASQAHLLLEALGGLINLEYLNLADFVVVTNDLFSDQFVKSLSNLVNLEELNLLGVWEGWNDGNGSALNQSSSLGFFAALGGMKKLRKLELGSCELGFEDGNYELFTQQLQNLTQLEYLGLSDTNIGYEDDSGHGVNILFQAVRKLEKLRVLDLSYNYIGAKGPLDAQIIAGYLNQAYALTRLDLGYTCFGFNDSQGMSSISDAVVQLKNLSRVSVPNTFREVNLAGNLEAFAARTTQGLQGKCQAELCFGSGITLNEAPLELLFTDAYSQCSSDKVLAQKHPADFSFAASTETKWSATQPEFIPLFMLLMLCVYAFKKISGCFVARSEEPQRARVSVLG